MRAARSLNSIANDLGTFNLTLVALAVTLAGYIANIGLFTFLALASLSSIYWYCTSILRKSWHGRHTPPIHEYDYPKGKRAAYVLIPLLLCLFTLYIGVTSAQGIVLFRKEYEPEYFGHTPFVDSPPFAAKPTGKSGRHLDEYNKALWKRWLFEHHTTATNLQNHPGGRMLFAETVEFKNDYQPLIVEVTVTDTLRIRECIAVLERADDRWWRGSRSHVVYEYLTSMGTPDGKRFHVKVPDPTIGSKMLFFILVTPADPKVPPSNDESLYHLQLRNAL